MAAETCASCGAPIVWRIHEKSGKRAPIDAEPDPGGNVILMPNDKYAVVSRVPGAVPRTPTYTNHYATCPDAAAWRARRRG